MVWRWSKTAATNATADSTINWAEGMAPSAVNDSARAEMARVAQWRDDISGAIVTGGSANVYTVSSNQVFDSLANMNNAMVAFTPNATNTGASTLNVDSLGAKPLRGAPGLDLPSGTLILGTPYVATYNNTDAVWYLQGGISNPYGVPIGGMIPYVGFTAPNSSFIVPQGQAISRATFSSLYALTSTLFGSGDGSTTFNVIDMRGRVAAGYDPSSATGRMTGAYLGGLAAGTLGNVGGEQGHLLTTNELPAHAHANTLNDGGHTHVISGGIYGGTSQTTGVLSGGANVFPVGNGVVAVGSAASNISINNVNAGGGAVHNVIQPTIICNYILRVI